MKNKKTWIVGRGIGIGLIAFSISLTIIFAFTFIDKQINIHKYENCIKEQSNIDICIPILNNNYYPQRYYEKPIPAPVEVVEDE
ncbi:hypothetical protein CL617_00660 [archaeon]|nr:hypothetical protein [archaeon]|tara:strand:+ start:1136 stop:1387 length:252 start_codon:yes stop_codon:yes gene_type:complete